MSDWRRDPGRGLGMSRGSCILVVRGPVVGMVVGMIGRFGRWFIGIFSSASCGRLYLFQDKT